MHCLRRINYFRNVPRVLHASISTVENRICGTVTVGNEHNAGELFSLLVMAMDGASNLAEETKKFIKTDPDCIWAHCLLGFNNYLFFNTQDCRENILSSFRNAKRVIDSGHGTKQERCMVAALGALLQNNYYGSAILLEQANIASCQIIIPLKIAQDIYRLLGDSKNTFELISRNLHKVNELSSFGHYLDPLITIGWTENIAFREAEFFAQKALNEYPTNPSFFLSNAHLLLSEKRALEGLTFLRDISLEDRWTRSLQESFYFWYTASFQLELCRVKAALSSFRNNLDGLIKGYTDLNLPCSYHQLSIFCSILWKINLQEPESTSDDWKTLGELWLTCEYPISLPFFYIHGRMIGAGLMQTDEKFANLINAKCDALFQQKYPKNFFSVDEIEFVKKELDLTILNVQPIDENQTVKNFEKIIKPIGDALKFFCQKDYKSCYSLLSRLYPYFSLMGGSVIEREILETTLIEASTRGANNDLAQQLISNRLVKWPCSGMDWNRYSTLKTTMGQTKEARQYYLNAHAYGVGQPSN